MLTSTSRKDNKTISYSAKTYEPAYRCPKCKREVKVLVSASVTCCRCGRSMRLLKTQ